MELSSTLRKAGVRRGLTGCAPRTISTGFRELDAHLAGQGWPRGALVELRPRSSGIGELRLLMPVLAKLSREARRVVWVAPPYRLSAPMVAAHGLELERVLIVHPKTRKEALWSVQQSLSNEAVGAVVCWFSDIRHTEFRALARTAAQRGSLGFCFLPMALPAQPSRLRLILHPVREGLRIRVGRQSSVPVPIIVRMH